jgi:hypothetical protein
VWPVLSLIWLAAWWLISGPGRLLRRALQRDAEDTDDSVRVDVVTRENVELNDMRKQLAYHENCVEMLKGKIVQREAENEIGNGNVHRTLTINAP